LKSNKWLILGTSPFIENIADWGFVKKYNSVAVNLFNKCPVDFRVANDAATHLKIIKGNYQGKRIFHKNNFNSLGILEEKVFYEYLWSKDIAFDYDKLCCRHTSAIAGINYALKKGAKEIILIGVDLTWLPGRGEWRTSEMSSLIAKALRFAEIYRVNPAEELPLSWLPLKEVAEL
jgi:hypothetical protein